MRKSTSGVLALCGILSLGLAAVALASSAVGGDEPGIMVSPSTIVLAKVNRITVHTNIPAATVVRDSLDLDGASPIGVGVDSLGHIVIKFALADLDLSPGDATLTLTGAYVDGGSFTATDTVRVK